MPGRTKWYQKLARSEDESVRAWVAERKDAPPGLLKKLAKDESPLVRMAVAQNPSTPGEALSLLAQDPDPFTRKEAIANPSAPEDLLSSLFKKAQKVYLSYGYGDWEALATFESLARNPSTPKEILLWLAGMNEARILLGLARNPKAPEKLLVHLSSKPDLRASVAQNPSFPKEALTALSQREDPHVRSAVAGNPSCPLELLETLAKDANPRVRQGVAGNPSAPLDLLETLVKDPQAKDHALANPAFPLPLAVEAALKWGWELYLVTDRFLDHLHDLPQDPKLWLLLWEKTDHPLREIISTHPFGERIALLARLGS